MTSRADPSVVLVATRGGNDLAASLNAVAAMRERLVVVDPLGRAAGVTCPRVGGREAIGLLGDRPVLALLEGESVTTELLEALATGSLAGGCGRVAVRHRGLGWDLTPRGGQPRYGAWSVARFGLGGAGRAAGSGAAATLLPGGIVVDHGPVEDALARLDAAAGAVAALLDLEGAEASLGRALRGAGGVAVRALLGSTPRPLGWGRWIATVLLAYTQLVTYAKLLERRGRPA